MHILLLSLYFAPDPSANSIIMTKLAEELVSQGHKITVVTSFPHYDINQIWPDYRGKWVQKEERQALRIYRTYLYVPREKTSIAGRILNYISFNLFSTIISLFAGSYDVILSPSPPLTIGVSAFVISRIFRIPYIYNVQDIYPDIAIHLGILTDKRLIKLFQWLERFVYDHSAGITVLSEGFRQNLIEKGVPSEKIYLAPNFIDTKFMHPLPRENTFAKKFNLHKWFVVMYAGNIGLSQGVYTLLEAAKLLQVHPDIQVMIVGNGTAKDALVNQAEQMQLKNVLFLPFQPRACIPEMYASTDVSLVLLRQGLGSDSVPSKAYTILASGRPLIAAIDSGTETHKLIDESQGGIQVQPESPEALASAILKMYQDRALCTALGKQGRLHVEQFYTSTVISQIYSQIFKRIAIEQPSRKAQPKLGTTLRSIRRLLTGLF